MLRSLALFYLKFFAKLRLLIEKPRIVGVAGSSGKTSLSLFLNLILSQKYKVKQSGGRNSETGIPLSILGLKISDYSYASWALILIKAPFKALFGDRFEIFIAEMGIDSPIPPKNMDYLLSILKPDFAVMTNITYEHAIYFEKYITGSDARAKKILDLIAKEELKLLHSLSSNNLAVVNVDNEFIKGALPLRAKTITVSAKNSKADYFIKSVHNKISDFEMTFRAGKNHYNLKINQPLPWHYAYTFIEAVALVNSLGIDVDVAIRVIETSFELPPGRASIFKGINRTLIIDSSYNNVAAEPLISFLEMINEIANGRRRVGVLGDMREQGEIAKIEHEKVARSIIENLDFVILIGESMKKYVAPILKSEGFSYLSFTTFTQAKEDILKNIRQRDLILVKSSQNQLFLERAVEVLLDDKRDSEKLARRGMYWEDIRRKTP